MPDLSTIEHQAADKGLEVVGALHPEEEGSLILLGPSPARFWGILQASPEASGPDPVDRWSARVVGELADELGARARFPFGTPVEPFITWALASGRCWQSPVGLLVHDTQGLMISFRGALHFDSVLALPDTPQDAPCSSCPRPCLTACPVGALGADQTYDLPACHGFLDTPGNACMSRGCAVRRACPVSPLRPDAQSGHHMGYFHQ